jgi:hypothetical protein
MCRVLRRAFHPRARVRPASASCFTAQALLPAAAVSVVV